MTRHPFRRLFVLVMLAAACVASPSSHRAEDDALAEALNKASVSRYRVETHRSPHERAAHAELGGAATSLPVSRLVDAHLEFLASDDLGGRETGTVHSQITGQYVASVFRAAGLSPGAKDGSYLQSYPMEAISVVLEETLLVVVGADGAPSEPLALFDDFVLRGLGANGADLTAGVVFAGYGIVSEKEGVDEYAGLDLAGRFALVLDDRPPERPELRRYSRWRSKRSAAKAAGAIGLLIVAKEETDSQLGYLDAIADTIRHPSMSVPRGEQDPAWPIIWLRERGAQAVMAAGGMDVAAELEARTEHTVPGGALDGVSLRLVAPVVKDSTHAYNILGVLVGSDPELRDEYVIVTAHNDHVGIMSDGRVNNGADDNASGTTTLLVAAQLMATLPAPRRSVLFLSVSGEEKGLLGSAWWVDHPTVPLQDCVANINIDMVGRNDPLAVGITPSPEHEDYNTMVTRAVEIGEQVGIEVGFTVPAMGGGTESVDDYYGRSDHYNFAKEGMPVVFFFSGVHEDYHRPTDEVDKIDRNKLRLMVDLVSRLVTEIANDSERPYEFSAEG